MRHVYNCGLVWLGSRQRFLDPESLLCSERLSPRTAIIISACPLPVARCSLPFVFSLACDIPPPPPRRDIWPNHLPPPVSRSTEHVRVRDCSLHDDFSSASSNSRKVLKSVANRRGDPLRFFLAISPMGPLRYREGKNKTVVGCLKNTAFAPEFNSFHLFF